MRADIVIGTRPEAIKMAPVINELRKRSEISVRVIATGQHTDMLVQALSFFGIEADCDLNIMRERQSLDYITASVLTGVGTLFDESAPDVVLVHGDTTTTMAAALAAFYRQIPTAHVEAGLRSFDMHRPFPEEMNRVVTDKLSRWHFAPTAAARDNLLRDGASDASIYVTGNTVVDALKYAISLDMPPEDKAVASIADGAPFMLLTAHRRESWGERLECICRAARRISRKHGIRFLVPMHKNPAVRDTLRSSLSGDDRFILCEPLGYSDFVWALDRCVMIMSDSGGVQEEATAIAKPVLILRDVTERPEAVTHGSGILVGTDEDRIFAEADRLLSDDSARRAIERKCEAAPFGDGTAAAKIADVLTADAWNDRTGH